MSQSAEYAVNIRTVKVNALIHVNCTLMQVIFNGTNFYMRNYHPLTTYSGHLCILCILCTCCERSASSRSGGQVKKHKRIEFISKINCVNENCDGVCGHYIYQYSNIRVLS